MPPKHDDSRTPRNGKPGVPSTGRGAASAMDALIKKRVPVPGSSSASPPQQPKQSKKR